MDLYALAGIRDRFGRPALLPNTSSSDWLDRPATFQPLRSTVFPKPSLWPTQFMRKLPDSGPWWEAVPVGGIA